VVERHDSLWLLRLLLNYQSSFNISRSINNKPLLKRGAFFFKTGSLANHKIGLTLKRLDGNLAAARGPNMKSIFIVLGETGENEQQRSWLVKAFPTETDALSFVELLESTYHSFAEENEELEKEAEEQLVESMRDLDENFELDPETGTAYSITICPFEGSTKPTGRRPQGDRSFQGKAGSKSPKNGRRPPRK